MVPQKLPAVFLEKCTDQERAEVESWWQSLDNTSRSTVSVLLDRRNDSRAYVYCDDTTGNRKWHSLSIVDDDVPFDDPRDYERECQFEYFQHLLDHPELVIEPDVVIRTFHICVAHPEARHIAEIGELDSNFKCPVGSDDCPIQNCASRISHAKLLKLDKLTRRTIWWCNK